MNNKHLFYGLGVLLLIVVGGVIGWLLRTPKLPETIVKETIVRDTVVVEQTLSDTLTQYITKVDTLVEYPNTNIVYADSIKGKKNDVEYSVFHKIVKGDSILSLWNIDVVAKSFQVFETTTYDSILTIHKTEYVRTPFFLDHWFYTSLAFLATTFLLIFY